MKKIITALIMGVFIALGAQAKVKLPAVFGDNMVLQQNENALFWGWTDAGRVVKIRPSWSKKTFKAEADGNGRWEIRIPTPQAGGPYTILFNDGEKLMLENVLVGEVWICMGQSNMEMPMSGKSNQPIAGSTDYVANASPEVPVRMLTLEQETSRVPVDSCHGVWLENTPENAVVTSATAQYFASYLQGVLKVPVGIVVSSWGGTAIRAWMSREVISEFPEYDLSFLDGNEKIKKPKYKATMIFNHMVYPIKGFTAKGFLWYQGESDRKTPELYSRMQPRFVRMLRDLWNNQDMPFYYVQIAPFEYEGSELYEGALLREAQLKNLDMIPNSAMIVTADVGDEKCIHPADKYTVGRRLALTALSKTYGIKGYDCDTPRYTKIEVENGKAFLTFNCGKEGLAPLGPELDGFEIAGEDRSFYNATARIEKGTGRLMVYSENVPEPVAVRYSFRNFAPASLYNTSGFPVSPFRTDDWPGMNLSTEK